MQYASLYMCTMWSAKGHTSTTATRVKDERGVAGVAPYAALRHVSHSHTYAYVVGTWNVVERGYTYIYTITGDIGYAMHCREMVSDCPLWRPHAREPDPTCPPPLVAGERIYYVYIISGPRGERHSDDTATMYTVQYRLSLYCWSGRCFISLWSILRISFGWSHKILNFSYA